MCMVHGVVCVSVRGVSVACICAWRVHVRVCGVYLCVACLRACPWCVCVYLWVYRCMSVCVSVACVCICARRVRVCGAHVWQEVGQPSSAPGAGRGQGCRLLSCSRLLTWPTQGPSSGRPWSLRPRRRSLVRATPPLGTRPRVRVQLQVRVAWARPPAIPGPVGLPWTLPPLVTPPPCRAAVLRPRVPHTRACTSTPTHSPPAVRRRTWVPVPHEPPGKWRGPCGGRGPRGRVGTWPSLGSHRSVQQPLPPHRPGVSRPGPARAVDAREPTSPLGPQAPGASKGAASPPPLDPAGTVCRTRLVGLQAEQTAGRFHCVSAAPWRGFPAGDFP